MVERFLQKAPPAASRLRPKIVPPAHSVLAGKCLDGCFAVYRAKTFACEELYDVRFAHTAYGSMGRREGAKIKVRVAED